MRHRSLTCVDHPELRWSCKDAAWEPGDPGHYNGSRGLSYKGKYSGRLYDDGSGALCVEGPPECDCPSSNLRLAPEDAEIGRIHDLTKAAKWL